MSSEPEWSTACPDWEARIVARQPLIPFQPLFPEVADQAQEIFGALRMVDATGSPLMSETVLPWALDFVRAIFGAYDPETGRRHINEFLLVVSKKNGKSSIAAGVMLVALIMNWRPSGEFIILAPTKEVADNSFKPIRDMIAADDELKVLLHVQGHTRTVTHRETGATLKVVAADSDTVSGKKAIGVFVDELHEFGTQPKAANMLLEATGGLTSRPEGFVIYATTQSADPPSGVFRQKLIYGRSVRSGKIVDKTFLPVIYEFPDWMLQAGKHLDFANAYVTNPNWGVSVDERRIEKLHKQAQEEGGNAFQLFLAKHLNVEVGLALRSDRWAGADFWESQGSQDLTLDQIIARCDVIEIGIDGGGLDDMLGLTVLGRDMSTSKWLSWSHAWLHPIALERRKENADRYRDFERDGDLTIVADIGDDVNDVADIALQVWTSGRMDKIGVDPAGIGAIVDALVERGIDQERIVGISQGWRMNGAIKTAERKLAEGAMKHGGSALMAWCVGNAKVEPKGNAVSITKQISGSGKIDPLMALFNAVSLLAMAPASNVIGSDYELLTV